MHRHRVPPRSHQKPLFLVWAAWTVCGASACTTSAIGDFTNSELCGTTPSDLGVSPQPLITRTVDGTFAAGSSVKVVGSPPPGALSDALATLGWKQDDKASLVVHVEGESTLSQVQSKCGASVPSLAGSYALVTKPGVILIAGQPEGQANALATLAQLPTKGSLPRVSILDGPTVPRRFVLEGYYGPSWTWAQDHQVLHAAAAQKLNAYIYAPKGDLETRYLWSAPFDFDELSGAESLAADAASLGMTFCWEISPGGAIIFSEPTQRQWMEERFQQLLQVGVSCFVLAFDDTAQTLAPADTSVYPSFAAGQLDFLKAMDSYLKSLNNGARLEGVTGNTYSTLMMQAYPAYVSTLSQLDKSVELGWTGFDIVSGEVTAADVALATTLLGRPPALGDNYPVAGTDLVSGPLNLWPIDGRDPAAFPGMVAYGGNGMTLARASIPALASMAELAWNPAAYDPARAFTRGLQLANGGPVPDGLDFFARLSDGLNETGLDAAPELRAVLDEYSYDPTGGAPELAAFFQRMAGIGGELAGINAELLTEIQPWIAKVEAWGRLGTDVLTALDLPSGTVTADMISALQDELTAVSAMKATIADAVMQQFATQSIASLSPSG
jgi:hyaluronoglucosaminidase